MNEEKVLSYLNMNIANKDDKTMAKISWGFNVGVTVFILIFGILLYRPSNYFVYILFCVLDAIYFVFLRMYRNPLWQIPLTSIGMLELTIKCFFAYSIISRYEFLEDQIPICTWLHAVAAVLAVGVIAYLMAKFYQIYKILKDNDLKIAKEKISSKNKMPKWIAVIASLLGSPMVLVRLFRDGLNSAKISAGFFMWASALIFVIIFTMLLPKFIILIRFKAWNLSK